MPPGRGASVPSPSYQSTALTIFCDPHGLISQLSLVRIATAQSVVISCRRAHACAAALRPILVRQGSQSRCIVRLNCLYLGRQSYRCDADGAILPIQYVVSTADWANHNTIRRMVICLKVGVCY